MRAALRSYVDARIETYRVLPDMKAASASLARSQALQADVWAQATAACRSADIDPGVTVLTMTALNQMFDLATTRLAASQMHPPWIIYGMLAALALASALLAGFQSAGAKAHAWVHQLGFAVMVAFTVYVILDMEFPRLGWIRLDAIDQVLIGVRAGMK
jgi:hypothetical protein